MSAGKNVIRMAELRSCFEAEGFRDVVTYIQSGNVIFRDPGLGARPLDDSNRGDAGLGVQLPGESRVAPPASKWTRSLPGRRQGSVRNPIGIATTPSS